MDDIKPLNFVADPQIGYTVQRRPDGGMHFVFQNAERQTLEHWRRFSLDHLLDSDRLTRNLYDLRLLEDLPDEAVRYAVEVNNDPATRNVRLAVLATHPRVLGRLREIAGLTLPGGVEMAVFASPVEAEAWLSRPLTLVA